MPHDHLIADLDLEQRLRGLRAEAPRLIANGEVTLAEFREAEAELMAEIRMNEAYEEAERLGLERAADLPYEATVRVARRMNARLAVLASRPCRSRRNRPRREARPRGRRPRQRGRARSPGRLGDDDPSPADVDPEPVVAA